MTPTERAFLTQARHDLCEGMDEMKRFDFSLAYRWFLTAKQCLKLIEDGKETL